MSDGPLPQAIICCIDCVCCEDENENWVASFSTATSFCDILGLFSGASYAIEAFTETATNIWLSETLIDTGPIIYFFGSPVNQYRRYTNITIRAHWLWRKAPPNGPVNQCKQRGWIVEVVADTETSPDQVVWTPIGETIIVYTGAAYITIDDCGFLTGVALYFGVGNILCDGGLTLDVGY